MGARKYDHALIRSMITDGRRNLAIVERTGASQAVVSSVRVRMRREQGEGRDKGRMLYGTRNPWLGRSQELPSLLAGLVAMLPDGGASITESDLHRWLDAVHSGAHLVYNVVDDTECQPKIEQE